MTAATPRSAPAPSPGQTRPIPIRTVPRAALEALVARVLAEVEIRPATVMMEGVRAK